MPKNPTQLNQNKTPKLRFPGFKGVWEEKKLDEVFSDINSKPKNQNYELLSVSLSKGITRQELSDKRDTSNEDKSKYKIVNPGEIAYNTMRMWQGAFGVSDILGIVSPAYTVIAIKDGSINFYKYLLKQPRSVFNFYRFSQGLTSDTWNLKFYHFAELKIKTPPLPEQQKIASFLGSVDEWIAGLRTQHAELVLYKKGVMQKIFSREIRFKDDKGNDFMEWEEKKLGEIGKSYNGLSGKSGEDFGEGEPFITYKQIFDTSELNINNFALVKVESNEKQNRAQFGDVFFTTSSETPAEVGFASVLLDKEVNPYLNSFSFGFRFNSLKEFDPYFAKFFFRTSIFRREVVKLAQGSTRYNISKIEFMKMKFNFPPLPEQQKIAYFLTSIDQLLESKQQQITNAEEWKKGLMQGLFV